ncbi:MAG TPA: glycosyltransferase [Chitinophagaceae bacterium]|nr:glycosyltransferase [Chitinophagaceae bacterium]
MQSLGSPIVSVVIPVYNGEKYLEATLRSVMNQSLKDIEIYVVNDASKDSSAAIVEQLQKIDSRIHLINKKNSGVADSRNKGLEASKGTFVAFLDQDDIWGETNLEEKVNAILESDKKWAFSDISFIDEKGDPLFREEKLVTDDFYNNILKWKNVIPAPSGNIVVLREFMGSDIRYDVKIPCPADRDICVQLARKAPPVFINRKLWQYRIHNESMSVVDKRVAREMAIMYDKYKREGYFPDKQTRKIALSTVYFMIAGMCFKFTGEPRKGFSFLVKSFIAYPALFFRNVLLRIRKGPKSWR